ncbi:DUF397 domain-containing protein [Streptomyces sp. ECR3.8]|uniref:DUF397 domain-containing protein n=1 Tax=Streptomyces sp. ECR3.8 TaxID=3461009 RepID=UPI004041EECE
MSGAVNDWSDSRLTSRSWRKSTYSGPEGGECIEVAITPAKVHVRDSKDAQGMSLAFESSAWAYFLLFAAER